MTNQKQMMTWSLRIQNDDYRHDFEQYGNKITSIGFHEWDVDASGKIAIYKLNPVKDANGFYTSYTDATTYDRYAPGRSLFPQYIEPDMKRWDHIEYYMQMVIFGPETVSRLLDDTTAQNAFISNLKTVVALFRKDQAGNDLGYTGIEIDCEGSWSDDKWDVRSGDDDKYINLLKRIKNEVIIDANPDFKLRINAHAMWGAGIPDYYRFHNYKLFAESVDKNNNPLLDEVQIMTYDFSWSGSAPGPSTPLWWMQNVAEWAKQNFDPSVNPKAKCTIDKVYLGGAGYGRRWGIYDENNWGSSVTYRNLVDWQNGYYIHLRDEFKDADGIARGDMADQDFIPMNAFNDPNSDNQIMFNHQYDYFKPRYLQRKRSMGQITARISQYNGIEYATAYSKNQHVTMSALAGITGIAGVSEPTHNLAGYDTPKRGETVTIELGGRDYTFQAYNTKAVPYAPTYENVDGQLVYYCALTDQPETVLTYKLNVATPGTYKVGAVVSFPFYGQTKLNGSGPGKSFTIGGDNLPDYYPQMFKGAHIWDLGTFNLVAGDNTFTIEGVGSQHGTIIYGFIASETLTTEVVGGYMTAPATVEQYVKRDGTPAKLPNQMALTNEVLQQSPRPAIIWEDYFSQFLNDPQVQGLDSNGDPITRTYTNSGLQSVLYYRYYGTRKINGAGTEETWTGDELTGCYASITGGYSYGYWDVVESGGLASVRFYSTNPLNEGSRKNGQLCLNYGLNTMNISAEVQFKMNSGKRAGIRFASKNPNDGYMFLVDFQTQTIMFGDEVGGVFTAKASAPLGDRAVSYGQRLTLRVRVNNGMVRCTIGGLNLLGDQPVSMQKGAVGFVCTEGDVNLYMMSIGTTDRWETLERFSIIADGTEYPLGELSRPGISRDEYGYLILSAFDEYSSREVMGTDSLGNPIRQEISLDYVFKPVYLPTWTGKKNIQIKLIDAGLWYKMLYIGDAEGMSITYAGDEKSFNKAMNIAVYDYGCKGIGLWVLGQADPRIYETLPDVVDWHE